MRILQVNKLYPPATGGIEKITGQIAEGLKGRTDMSVLACRKRGRAISEKRHGVRVRRAASLGVAYSMPLSPAFVLELKRMGQDADVILFHEPFPMGDFALRHFKDYAGRVVLWWHSDIVRQKKLMGIYGPYMRGALERADRIIVATKGHIEGSEYLGKYADKCVIIPYGCEVPSHKDIPAQRRECPVNFLFVGRLVPYKGCEYLLRALADVKDARLTICGDGVLEKQLKALSEDIGVSGRVLFKTGLSDAQIQDEYRECDVLVLPSIERNEAFGLVQIEAMAWGKPVINTNLKSGVPYVSLDGVTGFTVEPCDTAALAAAMNALASDAALREAFGMAARERVLNKFTKRAMIENTYSLFKELVATGGE